MRRMIVITLITVFSTSCTTTAASPTPNPKEQLTPGEAMPTVKEKRLSKRIHK